ncbi:hypothetical protein AJ80_00991 [Polytolypa hystricis UAMH7299]|uniref:Uncharacterized protein n=1 Tax=Polytolypa hystricis (strain UAMH7299) TaxID=1447883 RepID=A0A2B7Z1T1_POLH7|nr:hypothetical protein AJ80_00991 [Polytolypa hystricis UAMH7299]
MLPSCDPSTLSDNPQFKAVHQQLTTTLLNPDGSTRALEADLSRRAVETELKKLQIRAVKRQILRSSLTRVAHDPKYGLPDELRDLVTIILLYPHSRDSLQHDNKDVLSLLAPDLETFQTRIPAIVPGISNALSADITHLRAIANAGPSDTDKTNLPLSSRSTTSKRGGGGGGGGDEQNRPRNRLRPLSLKPSANTLSLSTQLSNRVRGLRDAQLRDLPTARRTMAGTAASVLATHAQIMERMIHILERTKHGALARAGKARAEHLSKVAEGIDGKVTIMKREILSAIYTPETTATLTNYRDHLGDTRLRLEGRKKNAVRALEEYGAADSQAGYPGAMTDIARRYGALIKEIEGVKMEIRRLGR